MPNYNKYSINNPMKCDKKSLNENPTKRPKDPPIDPINPLIS